jgi:hypothetical protein
MEVVSSCPMQVTGFVWQLSTGSFAQTIVVKASFVLEPGHAKLAPESEREPIFVQDRFVKDDTNGVLFAPTDRVPYKRRVDVLLVGHAYSPGKQPVRSLVTKLGIGDFSKSVEVFCDRGFRSPDERLLEGPRFTKMSLDYTRAAGGAGTTNPVGKRFDAAPDAFGLISVPNVQPPKTIVTKGSDTFAPTGYGPIAPTWPERTEHIDRFSGAFVPSGWDERPLPEGFDFEYFQAAPADQQIHTLRPDEQLVLENLHPLHTHLVTRLPDVCPRAVVHRASGEREDVSLVADTLWIDTDRGIASVVWRGSIGLRHPTEEGIIGVALVEPFVESVDSLDESMVVTIPPGVVDDDELASMTMIAPFGTKPKGPVVPFVGTNIPPAPRNPGRSNDDGALPFGSVGLAGIPPAPIAMGQITLPVQSPTSSPTVPEIKLPIPLPLPLPPPPAYMPTPPPISIAAGSTTTPSAWAAGMPSVAPAPRETIGSAAVALSRSTFVATDAAVDTTREMLQLLWYDTNSIACMRRVPAWKSVFEEIEKAPRSQDIQVADGSRETWEEDRENVFEILTKAPRTDAKGLDDAIDGAIGRDGKFVPPMVVLAGELELPFDELEALKAAMSTASPVITPADEQLKAAVAIAKDFVQTPGLSAAPAVSEGLTARIREAFVKEKKTFPSDYLDNQVERVLLSGRHYQKREVFGGMYVRCLIWLPGERKTIVGYLPADVSKKLPMWKRFRARVIAEVHPAQDQYEASTKAVKVVGVGRGASR